jgi:hypothetical protein
MVMYMPIAYCGYVKDLCGDGNEHASSLLWLRKGLVL